MGLRFGRSLRQHLQRQDFKATGGVATASSVERRPPQRIEAKAVGGSSAHIALGPQEQTPVASAARGHYGLGKAGEPRDKFGPR